MNAAQKTRLLEVVDADCEIAGRFMNEDGKTCAIGGLAKAAGMSEQVLRSGTGWAKVRALVADTYGLTDQEVGNIMYLNDKHVHSVEDRREDIRRFVETIPVLEVVPVTRLLDPVRNFFVRGNK